MKAARSACRPWCGWWGGDDRARARSDVGHSLEDPAANRLEKRKLLQGFQEPEGVAAADEESLRLEDRAPRVRSPVDCIEAEAHRLESPASLFGVCVAVYQLTYLYSN
jgi:hypothetical protein